MVHENLVPIITGRGLAEDWRDIIEHLLLREDLRMFRSAEPGYNIEVTNSRAHILGFVDVVGSPVEGLQLLTPAFLTLRALPSYFIFLDSLLYNLGTIPLLPLIEKPTSKPLNPSLSCFIRATGVHLPRFTVLWMSHRPKF